jgi:hypothetical protein
LVGFGLDFGRCKFEAQGDGFAMEVGHDPLTVLLFIIALSAIYVFGPFRQHRVDQASQLVRGGFHGLSVCPFVRPSGAGWR